MAVIDVGLDGNHSLNSTTIDLRVTRTSAGAYALGTTLNADSAMPVKYVGRADSDVNVRLKQHASDGKYKFFAYIYCSGITAAYEKECELYHTFGNLDNFLHPAKPYPSSRCPKCQA